MKTDWQTKKLGEVLEYEQPTPYIVSSKSYKEDYETPVLTAGKSFILGKTKEKEGIFPAKDLPVIIFDDFTTATKFVDFPFKVKSSAMKILRPVKSISDAKFLFYMMQNINFDHTGIHKRYWISEYSKIEVPLPSISEQKRIANKLDEIFEKVTKAKEAAEKNLQNTKELFESYLQSLKGDKTELGKLVDIKTGKLNANAMKKNGQYPFFTCAKEVFAIDKYAFDCEAILLAGNNAVGDFNVKHYKGKFNAYQRTYVITVNRENKILYRYLYFQLLNSLKEFKSKSVGSGTKFLKLGMIQGLRIILPTLSEQKIILKKLDALLVETKKLEKIYEQKLADLEELKKSVLSKAFHAEL